MRLTAVLTAIFLALALVPIAAEAVAVFSTTGADPAALTPTVDAFRDAIGGVNNGVGGSFTTGRREINWDGVPAAASSPNPFPGNFFNVNSPRGVIFSTPGTGFQVSGDPPEFGNLNATYPAQFTTFSAPKLFTPIGSNITDVTFFIPGTTIPATTSAFGAVFTDVDGPGSSIEFFDAGNVSLGSLPVPTLNQGLSFLGVSVAGDPFSIGRVRITSGNAAVGPNDAPPGTDVAVMDDFIYGEPTTTATTVPEPTTLFLLGSALVGLGGRRLAQAVRALRRR